MAGRKTALALGSLLLTICARAQQGAPDLAQELQRLGEAAAALDRSLPGFSCEENVVSRELHGDKVHRSVSLGMKLRAERAADGRLQEAFSITQVDGKPFTTGHFAMPVFVSGGFDKAMRYFAPAEQACYRYSLGAGRIEFTGISDAKHTPPCQNAGLSGFAQLDAAGNVTHLERRADAEIAKNQRMAEFAAVDFAQVTLNGRVYQLARHLYSEVPKGRNLTTFTADYTGCKLFTATVTIRPGPDSEGVHDAPPETLPH
jgi:hypothetical protein